MGQYKGKREASRSANHENHSEVRKETNGAQPVGDPFAKPTLGERLEIWAENAAWFFRSKKGKALSAAVCALLILGIGATVAVKSWVKPPELPVEGGEQNELPTPDLDVSDKTDSPDTPPQEPTDDELYPDDGYEGEMPTLSGQRKEGMYTFLLVGTDKDDGNTDTIMVASYDTVHQAVSIMSIPRDTMINESWDLKKINSVYSRTGGNIESLAKRVKKLVGFAPDFYVKVDLSVFVELVDLVGGVDFYVPQDMKYSDPYQNLYIDLKEGQQTLDGEKAMQLVRFRSYAEGDIKRVEVQQSFLKALIKECLSIKHWGKIKAYIDLAMEHVQTDLDFGSVVWFASQVLGLNGTSMLDMDNVYTCTIPGNYWGSAWSRSTNSNQSYVTVYAKKTVTLVNERFNPYVQNVTTGMLDIMSILDNGDIASSTGAVKDTKHNEVMAVRRGEAYYDANGALVYGSPNESETDAPSNEGGTSSNEGGTPPGEGGASNTDEPTLPSDEPTLPEDEPTLPDTAGEGTNSGNNEGGTAN